jgi:hypothetical protein
MSNDRAPEWVHYCAVLDRLGEAGISPELLREVDEAAMAVLDIERAAVLQNLVIGIYNPDGYPKVSDAITTAGAQHVEIDECDHRALAEMADYFADLPAARAFEMRARAQLEHDLGNVEVASAMRDGARRMTEVAS